MGKTIILKSNSFSYPTKLERKELKEELPKITRLDINRQSALISILKKKKKKNVDNAINKEDIDNAINKEDIYWWNLCLNNRYGLLEETYLYVLIHYNRFKKLEIEHNKNKYTEELLYEYYLEIFYYYFYSTRDIIAQLLNVLYNIKKKKVFVNKSFIKKIPNEEVRIIFKEFTNLTFNSYQKYRNAFTHRFTPTQRDNRAESTISISKDGKEIGFNSGKEISKEEFLKDCKKLMNLLSVFTRKFDELISNK